MRPLCFIYVAFFCSTGLTLAQNKPLVQHDTSYYVSYDKLITTRFYLSKKFTNAQIKSSSEKYTLNYRPNTTLNMGVGATYKWATLNLAYGFGFLNPERGRGDTKYLDLQFHSYGRKVVLDVFGQFYKGFYLAPKGYATQLDRYYLRPDLHINLIGTSAQYVFNHRQFSYRASFLQNEWQKKSAGTLLLGFEVYAGWVSADSSLIPSTVSIPPSELQTQAINFYEFGPNVGYAHTVIYKKHLFLTASASVSLDYGSSLNKSKDDEHRISGFSPDDFLRFFGGYNSDKWALSVVYVRDRVRLASGNNDDRQVSFNTGNFRLNYVRRFALTRKVRKMLSPVEEVGKP